MKKTVAVVLVLIIAVVCCWLFVLIRDASNTAFRISSQLGQDLGTLNPLQTAAAYGYGTPVPEGQLSIVNTRIVLEKSFQWFSFSDENIDGHTAIIAKLTTEGETHYPKIGSGFTGIFLGDPTNLSQIKITVPREASDGIWLIQSILASGLVSFSSGGMGVFFDWLDKNFLTVSVGGKEATIINKVQFVLERPKTDLIILTITPRK